MDLLAFSSVIIFSVALLKASLASEKECTDGFLNSLRTGNHRSGRLFPLLGRHRRTIDEQWIFPSLRFTCQGRLTKWIFRAAYPQSASPQCRINIGTWRLDRSSSNTIYRRMSTTERLRRITNDGPIFTYELATAVRVEPDDIVGVELESCLASGGFSNILSLDDNRTDSISPRHRQFEIDSTFRVIHLVPFLQPVIEAATLDKSSIRNAVSIAPNSTVDSTLSPVTMAPSTSSQAHEETRSTTRTDPHLTTTEGGSHIVNTNEPKDNDTLKIHIATGITALLGVIVICIGLVSIMKCIQAKSAKGGQTATGTEQPQVVVSSSNGALLQENTVHRKLMASWSSEKIGYEGGRNCNSEQWQNTSNSDHHVMVTMPTKEHSKHDDGTEPQDKPDSSGIVVQENTAYERSTDSVDTATQETTSSVQNTDIDVNQCSTSSSGIAVHKNTAYKKSTNGGDTVAEYEVMDETDEQVMQQNQAYGFQGESQEGTESANAGDYETMTGDSVYDYGSQTNGREDEKTTPAEPVMYDMPIQQQNTNPEDSEHSYDYII